MKRISNYILLREPPTPLRLTGLRCQVCQRPGTTVKDMEVNAQRVMLAIRRLKKPADIFKLIHEDQRQQSKHKK